MPCIVATEFALSNAALIDKIALAPPRIKLLVLISALRTARLILLDKAPM